MNDVFNFFRWPPRVQGFVLGILLMTLAAVVDSLIARGCP